MPICPICGYKYPVIYQVTEPSVCSVCCLEIEVAHMEFVQRRKAKLSWHQKMSKIFEEMFPVILHPNRIRWFLPDRYSAIFCV
jgi:hypothetical protein